VGKIDAPGDKYTDDTRPDWSRKCMLCKASPIVPMTGMCGPCTFGESETVDGNW
jgi:CO dehydrogenase/acetyl-CoA synthase alpha subunit